MRLKNVSYRLTEIGLIDFVDTRELAASNKDIIYRFVASGRHYRPLSLGHRQTRKNTSAQYAEHRTKQKMFVSTEGASLPETLPIFVGQNVLKCNLTKKKQSLH